MGDSNSRHLAPKPRILSAELHPDIHFPAMIPRRGVKIKFFLSVVIPVVKAAFVPFSATGGKPAIARAARLCGLLSKPRMDRVYALPNVAPYQLSHTRIFNFCHDTTTSDKNKDFSVCGHSCGLLLCRFRQPGKNPLLPVLQGFALFRPALPRILSWCLCRQIKFNFRAAREIVLPRGFGGAGRLAIQGLFAPELSTLERRLRADFAFC